MTKICEENKPAASNRERLQSLGDTIRWLRDTGYLLETDFEIDPDLEIVGAQKLLDGGVPTLFNTVKGKPDHAVVTNLFSDISVVNQTFGWSDDTDRTHKLAKAIAAPIKPELLPSELAPSQRFVVENPVDVLEHLVPIRHTELETELTIGSGIRVVSGDVFGGGTDVGYNRINFRWGNVGTFQIAPGSHMWQVLTEAYRKRERIPITFCFGVPIACTVMAGASFGYVILPHGCDELGVAGAIQGFPVRTVKAKTVDALALADAELVLEGYIDPRDSRYETAEAEADRTQGKHHFHPEWAGYMGKAYKAPTFHVTAITSKGPAQKSLVHILGVHTLDDNNLMTMVREASMFELCNRLQPGIVQDVHIPYSMTDWGGVIIQVKKRSRLEEGWQRNFLAALLSTSQGMRLAIAVSEDVNIYSMDEIMWCLTTRVNPRTDILNPIPGGRGQTFMPAERMTAGDKEWTASNTNFEGGMGIDATVPYGYEKDFMRPRYPIDRVALSRFFKREDIERATARRSGWPELLSKSGR